MGRAHATRVPLVSLCKYFWEKNSAYIVATKKNMIFYKSTHCPLLFHYPLSNHAVVARTMKILRIHLLLFDTRNLV